MGNEIWDRRYLQLAALISTWSKDETKVGAVLVRDNRIVGAGFNGFPTGVADDERLNEKVTKQAIVVHAEENALLVAGDRARGATLYVYGKCVCARCAASIIQAKVSRVIAEEPDYTKVGDVEKPELVKSDGAVNWEGMGVVALNMFKEARIGWYEGVIEQPIANIFDLLDRMGPDTDISKIKPLKERRKRNTRRKRSARRARRKAA